MDKTFPDAEAALHDLFDGATLLVGGFGLSGNPENCIRAVAKRGTRELTIVSNNCGVDGVNLGIVLAAGQVRRVIASYVGENKTFERLFLDGKIDVELTPQGTLAERIRAGGAGIPAFFTPTGVGTVIAEGKEEREFPEYRARGRAPGNGARYILERAIRGDFALVKAWKGDRYGNLVFRKTARNFNSVAATAADVCVAEVEHLVEPGEIEPDLVHTPGIYVHRIFQGARFDTPIEKRTTRPRPGAPGGERA